MKKLLLLLCALLGIVGTNVIMADPISDVSQLNNAKAYTIHSARGYWYVDDNNMLCTSRSATAPSTITDAYKFAILYENDSYYFYSLQAQGMMRRGDNGKGYFDSDMGNAFRFEANANGDYKLIARMKYPASINGNGQMLTINDNNAGSIGLDGWSSADGGNRLCIEEVEDFEPTSALAFFTTDKKFNSHKVYTVTGARGNWAASADHNSLSTTTANTAATEADKQFAVLKIDKKYYIYNVGAGKFLMKDGSLQDVKGDPMEYFRRTSDDKIAFFFENGVFLNMQGGGTSYAFNGYNSLDDGNAMTFTEVDVDVYDDAISVFYGSKPITYNIMISGTIVATEEREHKVGDPAGLSEYADKEFVTYSYSPATIEASTTSVDVTATVSLPFEVSTDFASAHWYNLKIGANQRYVGKEDSEPYHTHAATDDSEQDATEIVRASEAYQWTFMGNPVTGIKVINKEAGASYSLTSEGTGTNAFGTEGIPNTVLRSGDHYWDIHQNNDGFSLNLIGKSNYYINTHGGATGYFQIWPSSYAKTDRGSCMTVEAVPDLETTVTYNVTYNGSVVYTTTVPGVIGGTLGTLPADVALDFVTITGFDGSTEVTRDMVVDVTATWNGPFEISADYASAHWYDMAMRGTWYVTTDNPREDGSYNTVNANALGLGEDSYQWAFVGNPYTGFKVLNKGAGDGYSFGYTDAAKVDQGIPSIMADSEGNHVWNIGASTSNIANSFFLNVPGTALYINQYGGAGGSMKFWNSGNNVSDSGSAFTVFDVPTDYSEFVVSEITPYMESDATYFIFKPEIAATVGYDSSYKTNCPFAIYKGMKETLEDILADPESYIYPETGFYTIESNLYAGHYMAYKDFEGGAKLGTLTENASPASVVKLTALADHKYTVSVEDHYASAPAQSAKIGLVTDPVEFIAVPVSPGVVAFTTGENMGAIHCANSQDYYNVGWTFDAAASGWKVTDASSISVTISSAGYATLYAPFAVTIPENVTVSTISEINGNALTLSPVTGTIPAGTPVVLEGEAGTYTFAIDAGNSDAAITNSLTGTYFKIAAPNGSYILQSQDDKVGFYVVDTQEAQPNVPANRAYLPATDGDVKAFFFGEEDAIESLTLSPSPMGEGSIYNVVGQRMNGLQRGVNIVNGTKIIVK